MNLEKIVFKNDIDCFEVKGTNYNIECVQRYLKLEQNELQRMFIHSENLSQKYILWLKSELWFPLFSEEISVTFEFNNGVNINLPKYQIKTPYPNKSIKVACMKNGNKICNMGIPLVFNEIEDIKAINELTIKWSIKTEYNNFIIIHVKYNISFTEQDDNIFTLYTKDSPLHSFFAVNESDEDIIKKINKYLSKYNGSCLRYNYENNESSVDYLNEKSRVQYPNFESLIPSMLKNTIIELEHNKIKDYELFVYESDITLEHNPCLVR